MVDHCLFRRALNPHFKRITCQKLFIRFTKNQELMNIFELFCVFILTAYANKGNKIRMLFNLFDFENSSDINGIELAFLIRCVIVGYGKFTNT